MSKIDIVDIKKEVESGKLGFYVKGNTIYCSNDIEETVKVGKIDRSAKDWMPDKLIDITGQKFGKLTVLEYEGRNDNRVQFWLCKCDCGNESIVRSSNLKSGNSKSCGCSINDSRHKTNKANTKHGKCNTRLYSIWSGMKSRCNYEKNDSFNDYGKRGISVCDEWEDDFQTFYDWAMRNGYSDDLSIDRIDNDGNYEPSNCR